MNEDDEAFLLPVAPVKRPTNLTLRRMVRACLMHVSVGQNGSVH